jgi:hypothetical protein
LVRFADVLSLLKTQYLGLPALNGGAICPALIRDFDQILSA